MTAAATGAHSSSSMTLVKAFASLIAFVKAADYAVSAMIVLIKSVVVSCLLKRLPSTETYKLNTILRKEQRCREDIELKSSALWNSLILSPTFILILS